jgi:hypothetical protein
MAPTPARIAVFVLVSAGLIALAFALAPSATVPPSPPSTAAPAAVAVSGSDLIAAAARRNARLDRAATAFIRAFLRYEVGDLPASVARSLDRMTTARLGRYLLGARPRQLGARPAARIVKVETTFLDPAADRALVRGVARRADGPEDLSFVFVLRAGRWLAARAAE